MSLIEKIKEDTNGKRCLTKKEDILQDGLEVLIPGNLINENGVLTYHPGYLIGTIQGNDEENCELDEEGKLMDLNYYVVPIGKTFDSEIMTIESDIIVLGKKRVCRKGELN